jgi:hypothetical protein
MCDYSLMMLPNRLAVCGEELIAHKFRSGSLGFVGLRDYDAWLQERRPKGFWERLKYWLVDEPEPSPIVCMPPGSRVRMFAVDVALQQKYALRWSEDAVINQLLEQEGRHRDVFCFDNGAVVSLQALSEEQMVKILWLSAEGEGAGVDVGDLQRVE